MSKTIPLTQGKFAIVDDEDYEWLMQWKWYAHKEKNNYYVRRWDKGKIIFMHRALLNAQAGQDVDHINHNGLNNRRGNIRICTRVQNNQNRISRPNSQSKHKGVYWCKALKRWYGQIRVNGEGKHLGYFDSEIEAAKVYDAKAKEFFGEFAYLNFS